MHESTTSRPLSPSAWVLGLIVVLGLLSASCADAARPTLTADQLPDTSTTAPANPSDPASEGLSSSETANGQAAAGETSAESASAADPAAADAAQVEQLVVEIIESFPHDATAFTQGLELHDGVFIESTGLYGESELRRVTPATGETTQQVSIPDEFFAEGVTRVGDQLVQLTWQENTAFYWDIDTFERTKDVSYSGEGWGLCYDGSRLVMTDGTPVLIFRDPDSFDEVGRIPVTLNGQDVFNLNEVECVNGVVWANIWLTDLIVRIDPTSGLVTGVVDTAALDAPDEPEGAVLNGIAWDESTQSFYVTGKLWPNMYRVNFAPAPTG